MTVLISIVLISLYSCQRTEPENDLSGNYCPLGLGFEWTYRQIECSDFTVEITQRINIDGRTYFGNNQGTGDYLRSADNVLYTYRSNDAREYQVIDFNQSVGYAWQHPYFNRTLTILSKSALYDTIENCIVIASVSDLDSCITTYAPGIGEVASHLEVKEGCVIGGNIGLISAVINGETIEL